MVRPLSLVWWHQLPTEGAGLTEKQQTKVVGWLWSERLGSAACSLQPGVPRTSQRHQTSLRACCFRGDGVSIKWRQTGVCCLLFVLVRLCAACACVCRRLKVSQSVQVDDVFDFLVDDFWEGGVTVVCQSSFVGRCGQGMLRVRLCDLCGCVMVLTAAIQNTCCIMLRWCVALHIRYVHTSVVA